MLTALGRTAASFLSAASRRKEDIAGRPTPLPVDEARYTDPPDQQIQTNDITACGETPKEIATQAFAQCSETYIKAALNNRG